MLTQCRAVTLSCGEASSGFQTSFAQITPPLYSMTTVFQRNTSGRLSISGVIIIIIVGENNEQCFSTPYSGKLWRIGRIGEFLIWRSRALSHRAKVCEIILAGF